MATTVEEILVKFTGDASSLTTATDKAKAKTKSLEEEVTKLGRMLDNPKMKIGSTGHQMTLDAMEKAARKYSAALEKIAKQEGKITGAGGGTGLYGGGYGGGGGGRLGIKGAFQAGAGVATITAAYQYAAIVLKPVIEKGFKDAFGLTETFRKNEEEIVRSATLDRDRVRGSNNRELADGRAIGQMVDPDTGEAQIDVQAKAWRGKADRTQRELENANRLVELARADVRKKDTFGRQLPAVGVGQQMEYEDAQREEASRLADVERLKERRDAEMNKAADLEAGGTALQRMEKRLRIETEKNNRQSNQVGMKPGQAKRTELMQQLEDIQNQPGAILLSEIDKMVAKIEEEVKALDKLNQKKEEFAAKELVRVHRATRGFEGFEADVLARNSDGKQIGNKERLEIGYEKEADAINKKFLPATVKAQLEIERLNMLREKGLLNSEAYDKAILEQARAMDGGTGRAASRAATIAGSAESYARQDEYQRTMDQPKADSAAVDRAMKEARDNPVVKAIREQSSILRQIEKGVGKEGVVLKPANVE